VAACALASAAALKHLAFDREDDCLLRRAEGRCDECEECEETMKETEPQRLERIERDGPVAPAQYTDAERKRIAGAARQYSRRDFKPFDYSLP